MKNSFENPAFQYGVKLFLKYFLCIWVLTFITAALYQYNIIDYEKNDSINMIVYYANSIIAILLLLFFISKENKNHNIFKTFKISITVQDSLIGIFIGIAVGGLFPYIINSGYYSNETGIIYEFTSLGLKSLSTYFLDHTIFELIILGFLNTILFPALRAIFFFGTLYHIFSKELNVTKASIQVTLFFMLSNLFFQTNQLDLISLFGQGVIFSFLMYRTKSLLIVILASIFYDLPIYVYATFSDFIDYPMNYLVPTIESIPFILVWSAIGFFGFYILNLSYKVNHDE